MTKEHHKWHILNIKIHIKLKYNIRYKIIREDTTRGYIEMIQLLVHYVNNIFSLIIVSSEEWTA